jgi:hypothetical protein
VIAFPRRLQQFSLCDDFLPQFAMASDLGLQFSDAWFAARQVIDLGRRAAKPNPPPPPKPMIVGTSTGRELDSASIETRSPREFPCLTNPDPVPSWQLPPK